jgi:hypothetical protein
MYRASSPYQSPAQGQPIGTEVPVQFPGPPIIYASNGGRRAPTPSPGYYDARVRQPQRKVTIENQALTTSAYATKPWQISDIPLHLAGTGVSAPLQSGEPLGQIYPTTVPGRYYQMPISRHLQGAASPSFQNTAAPNIVTNAPNLRPSSPPYIQPHGRRNSFPPRRTTFDSNVEVINIPPIPPQSTGECYTLVSTPGSLTFQ